jgi:phosphoglycerol transferase MdoB-like AlkP superfamily enzyme
MSWTRFLVQLQKDIKLWLCCVGFLGLFRLVMVAAFRERMAPASGAADLAAACLTGLRFDAQTATLWTAPSLLLSALCGFLPWQTAGDRLRAVVGALFVVASVAVCGIDLGYFGEYDDQYDQFLLGVVFDDFGAIVHTIWNTYHVIPDLLAGLACTALLVWALRWWLRRPFADEERLARWTMPAWARVLGCALLAVLVLLGARGRIKGRPLQTKDAAITADQFLNKLVPDAWHALDGSIGGYLKLQRTNGLESYVPDHDLARAAATAFPEAGPQSTIDGCLLRRAPGAAAPPRHIFVLVMESYDAWPFLDRYRSLGLTDGVRELGRDGILVTDFVSASTGTMASLGAILTGLPDVGVYTDYQPSARKPFATSPAPIFKALGYRTRFFYSGYLSWHRIGEFCRDQGFDEVYGGGHIDGGKSGNEWGADDEQLFSFVERTAQDDAPTFSMILTTSNHPPFSVDVAAKGFPLRQIPPDLAAAYDGRFSLPVLGHLWYSDRCAARFIKAMDGRLPKALFALTGDHWSRRFLNGQPTFYERSAVPLLLYGPSVLRGVPVPEHPAGGHLDIAPTLIELSAPAGFAYHAVGENLLAPQRRLGLGNGRVIGPGFIAELSNPPALHPTTTATPPAGAPDPKRLKALADAIDGLAWWRIMRGNELPSPGEGKH